MKPETIKAVFTNLLFVIGVILLIAGFSLTTRTVVRIATFEKYPLASWEETRCDMALVQPLYPSEAPQEKVPSEELSKQKETCLTSLEYERKVKKVEDIAASLTITVSGIFLVFFFRKFILK